jgi:hypothetical protein
MLKTANRFRAETQKAGEGREVLWRVSSLVGILWRARVANTATHHLTSRCSSPHLRPRAKTVADVGDLRRVGRSAPTIGGNRSSDRTSRMGRPAGRARTTAMPAVLRMFSTRRAGILRPATASRTSFPGHWRRTQVFACGPLLRFRGAKTDNQVLAPQQPQNEPTRAVRELLRMRIETARLAQNAFTSCRARRRASLPVCDNASFGRVWQRHCGYQFSTSFPQTGI